MKINAERLNQRLSYLSQYGGAEGGGVTRYALTPVEREANKTVANWMAEAGLDVRWDAGGNLFGRLAGKRPGPAVLSGSHLDSVPNGGNYDGVIGVLGALEAVQSMKEQGMVPDLPIEVAAFVGEEGSRFPLGLLGSNVIIGNVSPQRAASLRGRDGVLLSEALQACGYDPSALGTAVAQPGDFAAYVELHIEQSSLLESKNLPAGIVTGIAGMRQLKGVIRGRAEHAGACPMNLRRDPMPAAAEVILAVERAARESHPATRATVGFVKPIPGASNVIPSAVELSFDIRDLDDSRRDAVVGQVERAMAEVCGRRGLTFHLTEEHVSPATPCDPAIIRVMADAAKELGFEPFQLPSGAVHDTCNLAALCPVGMLFVRSRDGLSHCPEEYSSPEDVAAGSHLLAETLWRLATK